MRDQLLRRIAANHLVFHDQTHRDGRSCGRRKAKMEPATIDTAPPSATVVGAPIRPAKSAPNGAMPMNITEYSAMTRPRGASGTHFWLSAATLVCVGGAMMQKAWAS
jgi:hypothetical protein